MKKILLIIVICISVLSVQAQKTTISQKDYEFILMSKPRLSQEYPNNKRIPDGGGTYYSFSYDGYYAFIYNEKHCGYYVVPSELGDGFSAMVPNLQKTNTTFFWQRVKGVMADIDRYWKKRSSKVSSGMPSPDAKTRFLDLPLPDAGTISMSSLSPDDETVSSAKAESFTTPHSVMSYKDNPQKDVFDVVEQMPSYPGGLGALMQYLSINIKYPKEAEEKGAQGRVITSFIVEKEGSISDVKIKNSVHPALDAEAIRVVKNMPKWIPGKQGGEPVRVKYTLPITFRMQ